MLAGMQSSFSDLFNTNNFKSSTLALLADVPEKVIQDMLECRPVERVDAEKVLEEISILLREEYTLEDVYVPLRDRKR